MALSYDSAHKPAAVNSTSTGTSTLTATSNAFSPQAGQVIVVMLTMNEATTSTMSAATPTNTGTALTWALINSSHNTTAPYGGACWAWWAYNASTQASITVSSVVTWSAGPTCGWPMVAVHLWDGADTGTPIGAKPAASSSASPWSVSVTPQQAGSALCALAVDWSGAGAFSDSSGSTWATDKQTQASQYDAAAGMYGTSATAPTLTPNTNPVSVALAEPSGSPAAIQGFAWEVRGAGGTNATATPAAVAKDATVPAQTAQAGSLSGPNNAGAAADLGGGAGSWSGTVNAQGGDDGTYATWAVP